MDNVRLLTYCHPQYRLLAITRYLISNGAPSTEARVRRGEEAKYYFKRAIAAYEAVGDRQNLQEIQKQLRNITRQRGSRRW